MAVSLVDPHGRWAYPAGITGLTQFTFVALNASGQLILPSANGIAIGILDEGASTMNAGTLGANGEYSGGYTVGAYYGIVFSGVQKVYAAATLAAGVPVATNSSGQAVAVAGTGTYILGVTMASAVSGDLVPVNVRTTGAIHY